MSRDRSHSVNPQREAANLPAPHTVRYYDAGGHLRPELVDQEAEEWAKRLADVRTAQLRRFYDSVLALERQIQLQAPEPQHREKAFQTLKAQFKMLRSKAAYTQKRNRLPEDFLRFFVNHTASVQNYKDFEAFRRHFEAVMGFHRFFAREP